MRILSALLLLGTLSHASDYRYQDDRVALESAANRGLTQAEVTPKEPFAAPRSRPLPVYAVEGRHPGRKGSVEHRVVKARLSGSHEAPVNAGFPLPQGAVFDPRHIRLLGEDEVEIPVQVNVTTFWPDGSIRWVLLQFAGRKGEVAVEFGNAVERGHAASPLRLTRQGKELFVVETGAIRATVDFRRFNLLAEVVSADGWPFGKCGSEGVRLAGADGSIYSTAAQPPDAFAVEQEGAQTVVLRAEGAYADANGRRLMRYVTRLIFHAGSPRVEVVHRHVNDALEHEFSDLRSLELVFEAAGGADALGRLLLPGGKETPEATRLALFEEDENKGRWSAGEAGGSARRSPGALELASPAGRVGVICRDFWQRWPKALGLEAGRVTIGLLPPQPEPEYGGKLPAHLRYPFVEGLYRLKWGMAFTERVVFDFGGSTPLPQLASAVQEPPLAIFPSDWYAETGALALMAPVEGKEFAEWDAFFEHGSQAYLRRREKNREYGFLNYGDWFGERGRNWGNNEYDIAHAFFMQFARTGEPRYYRIALAAARHQADVDIVHAYPDPFYIGANPEHSIGHTGQWMQTVHRATWSHRFDRSSDATNGHTWAEGMAEAWWLAGEPTVMESALLLGEHIAWAVAPKFKFSVNYPRSAGWSLRAVLALYDATADPEYLRAAGEIARAAVAGQDASGIWLRSFAKKGSNEEGVSTFQLGLTLAALARYDATTGDPTIREALRRGVNVLAGAWPGSGGWPYDIRADGTANPSRPRQSLVTNILNAEAVAYLGWREKDPALLRVAEEALRNTLFYTQAEANKQSTGLMLRSGQAVLGALHAAYRESGARWPGLAVKESPETYFHGVLDARKFDFRGPGRNVLRLKTEGQALVLHVTRERRDRFGIKQPVATLRLRDEAGALLWEKAVPCKGARQEVAVELPEGAGNRFDLEIDEPDRGIWNLDPAPLAGVMFKADQGICLSGVTLVKYVVAAQEEGTAVSIAFRGVHPGVCGVAVLDEAGSVLGFRKAAAGEQAKLDLVAPKAGRLTLVLWAPGDLEIALTGMAPWVARNEKEFFVK